jgi:hypothetical protein
VAAHSWLAPTKINFIEIFNRSNAPVDFEGKSLHIASDNGPFLASFSFISSRRTDHARRWTLLIEFETAGTSGGALPFFDLFVSSFPAALQSTAASNGHSNPKYLMTGPCAAAKSAVDFVGRRTATCSKVAATAT